MDKTLYVTKIVSFFYSTDKQMKYYSINELSGGRNFELIEYISYNVICTIDGIQQIIAKNEQKLISHGVIKNDGSLEYADLCPVPTLSPGKLKRLIDDAILALEEIR